MKGSKKTEALRIAKQIENDILVLSSMVDNKKSETLKMDFSHLVLYIGRVRYGIEGIIN